MGDSTREEELSQRRLEKDQVNAIFEAAAAEEIARVRRYHLERLAAAFKAGRWDVLPHALGYCYENRIVPPAWVVEATELLVEKLSDAPKEGRGGRPEDALHFERWDMVTQFMSAEGLTIEAAAARVSDELHGTPDAASDATIRRSYYYVEREYRAGRGAKFYVFRNKCGNVL